MNYDPVSGNRWPGFAGSPLIPVGRDLSRVSEERRYEWDEKASGQMRTPSASTWAGEPA